MNAHHSTHRRIAQGFLWVAFFVVVAKLAGAGMNMALAWRYGIGDTVDAYVFLTTLITWPVAVWFSVLSAVLVPLIAKTSAQDAEALRDFNRELLGINIVCGILLAVAFSVALPSVLGSGWAGLSGAAQTKAQHLGPLLAWILPLGLTASVASAWLLALGYHRNTLLEGVPSLALLCALLLPVEVVSEPLMWGALLGAALQLACLAWPLYRSGWLYTPRLGFGSPLWRDFRAGIGIMLIGQLLMSVTTVIDQSFAAHLGPGSISILNYGNRLMSLCTSLSALAISRSTLPVFSGLAAQGQPEAIRVTAGQWATILGVVTLLSGALMWAIAPELIAFLFERGKFTAQNTTEVASVFRILLLQLPFYASGLVFAAALASQKRYSALFISSILALSVKLLGNALSSESFGIHGVALSTALMYLATTCYMGWRVGSGLRPTQAESTLSSGTQGTAPLH